MHPKAAPMGGPRSGGHQHWAIEHDYPRPGTDAALPCSVASCHGGAYRPAVVRFGLSVGCLCG